MAMSQYQIRRRLTDLRERINAHERRGQELKAELAEVEELLRQAARPNMPVSSVVAFKKTWPGRYGREYSYVALRYGVFWYVTQDGAREMRIPRKSWEELLDFIGAEHWDTMRVPTGWEDL